MNILFVSSKNPDDIHIWSGTLFHIWHNLKERHSVRWIGGELLPQSVVFSQGNFAESVYPERYAELYGQILSERVNGSDADLLFLGDINLVPYLETDIPLIYLSDVAYPLFKDFAGWNDRERNAVAEQLEQKTLERAARILYPSEWVKRNVTDYYGISADKIDVVEFGANIPDSLHYDTEPDLSVCRLLFIGKEWRQKGGDKVLGAYRKLKQEGFRCQLTVIGSVPDGPIEADDDLVVIPFLDKSKSEEMERMCRILAESHFFVLPTVFDAYGIVFCEASANGVPSIAADVGGVGQPVREGKNGYLLPPESSAEDYALKIKETFKNRETYRALRVSSRREYETRLNWKIWGERVDRILETVVAGRIRNNHSV